MRILLLALAVVLTSGLVSGRAEEPPLSQDVLLVADEGLIGLHLTVTVGGKDVRESWSAYLDRVLRDGDANGDGTVTWEELAGRLPTPSEVDFLVNSRSGRMIETGENAAVLGRLRGPVTRAALNELLATLGFGPLTFRYASDSSAGPGVNLRANAQTFSGVLLFARLDRDGNTRLSRAELQEGLATLQHLDENEDDLLSPVELDSSNRPGLSGRIGSMGRSADTGPFLLLPLGDRTDAAVRTLLRRYDHSPARDGTLTAAELGLGQSPFAGYDKDESGALDRSELAALLQRPPLRYDVQCDLPVDGRPATVKVIARDAADLAPREEPGRITVQFARLEFGLTGLNAPAFDPSTQVGGWLRTLDRDQNDYLDEAELRNFGLQPLFKLVDGDGDGKATAEELSAWVGTRVGLFEQQIAITAVDSSRNLFESLDANRDGRLSAAEFRRGAEQLAAWDANGDGELADLEVPQRMTLTFARDVIPLLEQRLGFARPAAMMGAGRPSAAPSGPAWFAAMDRNSDGEISRQEFVGPLARFAILDRNQDGRIDGDEAGR